jgi:hypothetical protein
LSCPRFSRAASTGSCPSSGIKSFYIFSLQSCWKFSIADLYKRYSMWKLQLFVVDCWVNQATHSPHSELDRQYTNPKIKQTLWISWEERRWCFLTTLDFLFVFFRSILKSFSGRATHTFWICH